MKPQSNGEIRIGFYICHCGTNIAGVINVKAVAEYAATLPGVAVSRDYKYSRNNASASSGSAPAKATRSRRSSTKWSRRCARLAR